MAIVKMVDASLPEPVMFNLDQEQLPPRSRLTPEGPNVALEEVRGLLDYLTPALLAELAEVVLRRVSDDAAQVVILNRLCRAEPDVWATVAEQLTQLLARQYASAMVAVDEARKLRDRAAVMERYAQSQRMSAETCALRILRSLPVKLTSGLTVTNFQTAEGE